MRKIKNMFEKHDLFKIILLVVLVTIVFTWIIPAGSLSGGTYVKSGLTRQGLADIMLSGVFSANFFIQQLMFILFVGMFYGILSHVSGYKALVSKVASKFKGKEKVFVLVSSFVIALLTSILSQTYVILIFIPFIINIASKMNLDKITAFLCTFGSMLVGILGATYGSEGFVYFINYLNYYKTVSITEQIGIRFGILALAYILFTFFMVRHMNKALSSKKNEETVDDLFVIEEEKSKKIKVWPMALFLIVIFVFTILGYVNWSDNFNITAFTKFHTWLTDLAVGDYTILSYIVGKNATAFGAWDLYTITIVMAIVLLLSVVIYGVKFDDLIDNAIEGLKKFIKPILILLLVYIVFVFVYWCPFTVTICNWITSFADGFNPFLATICAGISSFFHIDFGFAGYALGDLLVTTYGSSFSIGMLIYVTINGLVGFVAPTSAIMLLGLTYLDIPYRKWIKYIWKFALVMLALLLIVFVLLTYV